MLVYEDITFGAELYWDSSLVRGVGLQSFIRSGDESQMRGKFPEDDSQFQQLPEFVLMRMSAFRPVLPNAVLSSNDEHGTLVIDNGRKFYIGKDGKKSPVDDNVSVSSRQMKCFFKDCKQDWFEDCKLCKKITHYLHGSDRTGFPLFCSAHHDHAQHKHSNLEPQSDIDAEAPPEQQDIIENTSSFSNGEMLPECVDVIFQTLKSATHKVRFSSIFHRQLFC